MCAAKKARDNYFWGVGAQGRRQDRRFLQREQRAPTALRGGQSPTAVGFTGSNGHSVDSGGKTAGKTAGLLCATHPHRLWASAPPSVSVGHFMRDIGCGLSRSHIILRLWAMNGSGWKDEGHETTRHTPQHTAARHCATEREGRGRAWAHYKAPLCHRIGKPTRARRTARGPCRSGEAAQRRGVRTRTAFRMAQCRGRQRLLCCPNTPGSRGLARNTDTLTKQTDNTKRRPANPRLRQPA